MTKTYFLPPDFLSCPAGDGIKTGRLRLGQLIHDIDDPASTIATLPPHDLTPYKAMPINHMNIGSMHHKDSASSSHISDLFVKAVGLFGAKLRINSTHSEKLLATMSELDSLTIDPTDEYVADSLGQDKVQTWLKSRWFEKRIFMVTSVLIARPDDGSMIKLSTNLSTENEASGEVDATLATSFHVPVKAGAVSKGTSVEESDRAFMPKTPFVYAFKVRECFYKKNVGSSKAYYKGAKLHAGDGDEQGATEDEIAEFELSGIAQEDVTFDDLGDMDEKFVSHGFNGEEFSFVVSKVTP